MVENSYYERKIKYLDLMESGERTGSAGFVKIEVKGMEISLLINVKGLHPTDTYEREVLLQTEENETSVGRIALQEGQGQFQYHMTMDHSQLQGIRIALGGAREICCKWQEKKRNISARESTRQDRESSGFGSSIFGSESSISESETSGPGPKSSGFGAELAKGEKQSVSQKPREIQIIPWDEVKAVEESLERVEKILSKSEETGAWKGAEKAARRTTRAAEKAERAAEMAAREAEKTIGLGERTAREPDRTAGERTASGPERTARESERTAGERTASGPERTAREPEKTTRAAEKNARRRPASGGTLGNAKRPVRLMEDKWQQLWAIYPHIHPFRDEREYLSISPADFVLLPDEAYRAANNSFLLHGYYNYDHLILTKIEKRGEVSYFIGVPGNYYEREKQVAVMFGFESFECGTEPAQAGDFGYYMMRTQL